MELKNLQFYQLLKRLLPSLPFSPDIQQFLKKLEFQRTDITDDE